MIRGRKLHREIASESTQVIATAAGNKPGRSSLLLERRNLKLCYRFYYYTRILKLRFDLTIEALHSDFDLSPATIGGLLEKLAPLLKEIGQSQPSIAALRKLYPLYSWLPPSQYQKTSN